MKRILLLIAIAITLVSCDSTTYQVDKPVMSNEAVYQVVVIDSCQYVFRQFNGSCMFSHKGNCNNPIHKHQ